MSVVSCNNVAIVTEESWSECEQGHLRRDWYDPIARWSPVSVIIFGIFFFLALQLCDRQPHET